MTDPQPDDGLVIHPDHRDVIRGEDGHFYRVDDDGTQVWITAGEAASPPVPRQAPPPPSFPEEIIYPHGGISTVAGYLIPRAAPPPQVFSIEPNVPEVDPAERPHFMRSVEDQPDLGQVCGQDGEPWPCTAWREANARPPGLPEGVPLAGQEAQLQPARGALVDVVESLARAAGLTVDEFKARLADPAGRPVFTEHTP